MRSTYNGLKACIEELVSDCPVEVGNDQKVVLLPPHSHFPESAAVLTTQPWFTSDDECRRKCVTLILTVFSTWLTRQAKFGQRHSRYNFVGSNPAVSVVLIAALANRHLDTKRGVKVLKRAALSQIIPEALQYTGEKYLVFDEPGYLDPISIFENKGVDMTKLSIPHANPSGKTTLDLSSLAD